MTTKISSSYNGLTDAETLQMVVSLLGRHPEGLPNEEIAGKLGLELWWVLAVVHRRSGLKGEFCRNRRGGVGILRLRQQEAVA